MYLWQALICFSSKDHPCFFLTRDASLFYLSGVSYSILSTRCVSFTSIHPVSSAYCWRRALGRSLEPRATLHSTFKMADNCVEPSCNMQPNGSEKPPKIARVEKESKTEAKREISTLENFSFRKVLINDVNSKTVYIQGL